MMIKKIDDSITAVDAKSGYIPPFRLNVCLYIVDRVLIDAGASNILRKIKSLLQKEKIDCAALTHVHEDHTGAAAWVKNNLKVPVYLHKNSIDEAAVKSTVPLYRKITWGNRDAFIADPMPPVIETETKKFKLDVIESPGHHSDHVVFHEKNHGWLFSGDMYVSRKQLVAFKDENIDDAIRSLKKLIQLDIDKIFCGHSGIHSNAKEKLKSKLDFFLDIQHKVNTLKKDGLSLEEIDKRLFPKKNLWTVLSRGEWSTFNIVKTI
jgi:glyoxylase-like metal-dependent hydrolase (beta-lactamase superfamily II)